MPKDLVHCGIYYAVPCHPMVHEDGIDSGTDMLEPGALWDVPCCTFRSKKSGALWHVPLRYTKGILKSHGMAVGNAGQPSHTV